jgi:hypothetical protein
MSALSNPEAEAYFERRCARDEVGTRFMESLRPLGEYEVRGDLRSFRSPYAVTAGTVFGGALDMDRVLYRLSAADRAIALRTGAEASPLGDDWVVFTLFRSGWPALDLEHWARAAYRFARGGG